MKKLISAVLVLIMAFCCTGASAATNSGSVANSGITYGADNLNDKTGDLVIGFLGGSITEGSGASSVANRWSSKVVNEYFRSAYPNKNVVERNASIGGTGSEYGMIRMRKDLSLDSSSTPDVVFVEFAVNDAWGRGMTLTQNMESIVRQLISLPKIPVIIFVYTTSADSYYNTGSRDGKCVENAIDAFHVTAENYGIYEINLNDYIWEGVKSGKFVWKAGASGALTGYGTHPNDGGHKVYAERITELLKKDKSSAFKKPDRAAKPCGDYVYGSFEEVAFDDPSVKLTGNWVKKTYTLLDMNGNVGRYFPERFFRKGYMHAADGTKATAEFEFTGCGIGVDYVRTKNNAVLNYTVYDETGNKIKEGTSGAYYKSDTGRCCGNMLVSGLPHGRYKIVLTGALNTAAVEDNKENSDYGGSGLELNMGYFAVEKSNPEDIPTGDIAFKTPVSVKVNGNDASAPAVGENTFSGTLVNSGNNIITVRICASVYENCGNKVRYKKLSRKVFVTKTLKPGTEESFSFNVALNDTDTDFVLAAFSSETLEPVKIPVENVEYIGKTDENDTVVSTYRINKFK